MDYRWITAARDPMSRETPYPWLPVSHPRTLAGVKFTPRARRRAGAPPTGGPPPPPCGANDSYAPLGRRRTRRCNSLARECIYAWNYVHTWLSASWPRWTRTRGSQLHLDRLPVIHHQSYNLGGSRCQICPTSSCLAVIAMKRSKRSLSMRKMLHQRSPRQTLSPNSCQPSHRWRWIARAMLWRAQR